MVGLRAVKEKGISKGTAAASLGVVVGMAFVSSPFKIGIVAAAECSIFEGLVGCLDLGNTSQHMDLEALTRVNSNSS